MGSGIALGLYVAGLTFIAGTTAGLALSRFQLDDVLKRRVLYFFFIVACSAPVLRTHLVILMVGTVSLWLLLPKDRSLTVPFCLASLLVVPDFFAYDIPFPGVNLLLTYTLWLGVAWIAFLPLLFRDRQPFNAADFCVIGFVLTVVILGWRDVSVTQGVRQSVVQFSTLAIPYLAASRSLRGAEERSRMQDAIVIVAVILCCVAIYMQIVGWHFMSFTSVMAFAGGERRFGLLRTGTTMANTLFGLVCSYAFIIVISRRAIVRGTFARFAAALLFIFGLFASGTRGAMFGGMAAVVAYLAAPRLNVWMLRVGATALVVSTPLLINYITSAEVNVFGEQGTVVYRQQLLAGAMRQFSEAPLFGDHNFLRSPHLAHLVQGQGIIDIVNSYLQFLLTYGIVGLGLFVLAAYLVMRDLVREMSRRRKAGLDTQDLGLILAFLAGYLVLIATTSQVSYVPLFGLILLGIGRAAATGASRPLPHS